MNYKILIIVTTLLSLKFNAQELLNLKEATIITLENNLDIKIFENFEIFKILFYLALFFFL